MKAGGDKRTNKIWVVRTQLIVEFICMRRVDRLPEVFSPRHNRFNVIRRCGPRRRSRKKHGMSWHERTKTQVHTQQEGKRSARSAGDRSIHVRHGPTMRKREGTKERMGGGNEAKPSLAVRQKGSGIRTYLLESFLKACFTSSSSASCSAARDRMTWVQKEEKKRRSRDLSSQKYHTLRK